MKISLPSLSATILLFLAIAFHAAAQDVVIDSLSHWKKKLNFGINVNQASFSSNWKAGGINSIGMNGLFNYKANYKDGRRSWDNEIDLLFGFVNNKGQGYRKTNDRIFLDTKYGYSVTKTWDLFTSINFLSQFAPGRNYVSADSSALISAFLAPAFITSAWGAEYHPTEYFKVRLAPIAPRLTVVQDPRRFTKSVGEKPYGVDSTKTTRVEWFAFQLLAEFNKDIATNINLKWRYMMFANYQTLQAKKIDHRLDLNLTAKVNKYVNVGIGGILIYDYDQDKKVQLSQLFTLGFLYTFQNYKDDEKK
jgi:hypothetical protein